MVTPLERSCPPATRPGSWADRYGPADSSPGRRAMGHCSVSWGRSAHAPVSIEEFWRTDGAIGTTGRRSKTRIWTDERVKPAGVPFRTLSGLVGEREQWDSLDLFYEYRTTFHYSGSKKVRSAPKFSMASTASPRRRVRMVRAWCLSSISCTTSGNLISMGRLTGGSAITR